MATTQATTANPNERDHLRDLVIFTVDAGSDEHLQDVQAIRDEAAKGISFLTNRMSSPSL